MPEPIAGLPAAFNATDWRSMYDAVATAAIALAGLLFVAMSINLSRILTDAAHVARAREALGGLLALFVIAVFVLIPGQRPEALGWELIGFSLVIVAIAIRLQGQTIARIDRAGRLSWAIRTLPLNSGTLTLVVAGVSLVRGAGGGLYWLVPTIIIYFSWAALNAWILVVGASDRTK